MRPILTGAATLIAALTAVVTMIIANGLPKLRHPVFGAGDFDLATRNRFFLCIEATDQQFDLDRTRAFMNTLGAHEVTTVAE